MRILLSRRGDEPAWLWCWVAVLLVMTPLAVTDARAPANLAAVSCTDDKSNIKERKRT